MITYVKADRIDIRAIKDTDDIFYIESYKLTGINRIIARRNTSPLGYAI